MSTLYRFGFEFGQVPNGVTINSGKYFWRGRAGNCCLYGNWPNISGYIHDAFIPPYGTTQIMGSFYVQTFNHNLNDVRHNVGQQLLKFGGIDLVCSGSGQFAINVDNEFKAMISGIEIDRGEWVPIKFDIQLGNALDSSDAFYRFDIKNESLTGGWISLDSYSFPQQGFILGGLGGTGTIEDIAINISGGNFDTGIPNMISAIPAFYTGNGNQNQWSTDGTLTSYVIADLGTVYPNRYGDPYYCPSNNTIYFTKNFNANEAALKLDPITHTFSDWIIGKEINRICYIPSRDSIICCTGVPGQTSRRIIEVDLDGNIINNDIWSLASLDGSTYYVRSESYYNSKTNKIYFVTSNTTVNRIFYLDAETLSTGNIFLTYNLMNNGGDNVQLISSDWDINKIYYRGNQGASQGKITSLDLINYSQNTGIVAVGPYSKIPLAKNLNSGFFSAGGDQLFPFNLDTLDMNVNNQINLSPHNTYDDTSTFMSYSKLNNTLLVGDTITFVNLNNTGDYNTIEDRAFDTAIRNNRNTVHNYCSYNNTSYAQTSANELVAYSHHTRSVFNPNLNNYNYIQYPDNNNLKTSNIGYIDNSATMQISGNTYEGTNIYTKIRRLSTQIPVINIGINETGQNKSLYDLTINNGAWQEVKASSFYDSDGNKLSVIDGNSIQSYIKYSGTL